MKKKLALYLLPAILIFLGIGAIGGGAALIIFPSGNELGMPLYMLTHSPFKSFLIPGIILFTVLGIAPIVVAIALIKKPESKLAGLLNFYTDMYWAWTYSIYIAFTLIIWIQVEMIILDAVHWLHTFYMFYAIVILFVALLPHVRNLYRKQ